MVNSQQGWEKLLKPHNSLLTAFLLKGLKFKEFKSQWSTGNGQQSIGLGIIAQSSKLTAFLFKGLKFKEFKSQ